MTSWKKAVRKRLGKGPLDRPYSPVRGEDRRANDAMSMGVPAGISRAMTRGGDVGVTGIFG